MKKIRTKILQFLSLVLSITFLFPQVAFASMNDIGKENISENAILSEVQSESLSESPIPNIIEVKATKMSADKVKISVFNLGIDTFDSVSCQVKIRDANGLVQYSSILTFTDIFPLINQSYEIYHKSWAKVEVSNIYCQDGTDTGYLLDFELYP